MLSRQSFLLALLLLACCSSSIAFAPSLQAKKHKILASPSIEFRRQHLALQQPSNIRAPSSTSLQMSGAPMVTVAAVAGALSGGLFAGGLHAIAGTSLFSFSS